MDDPIATELVTDANFDAQRYLLANADLADPYRDGLEAREHFDRHGRAEGRRQLAGLPAIPPQRRSPGVTLVAIVRNEGLYLLEWLAYHRLLGFERMLIYDNQTDDGSEHMLARLAAAGLIGLRHWPDRVGYSTQLSCYADAVIRCATRWILFLDLDEFLNLPRDPTIGAFLARFPPGVAAIGINWRLFGSGGRIEDGAEPVTTRFTRAAPREHPLNRYIKTIAVASEIYKVLAHRVRLMHGRYVDASGAPLDPGRGFAPVRHDAAQINHYAVKSLAEFAHKRRRGSVGQAPEDATKLTHYEGSYFADHDRNEEVDKSILRHATALAAEMERLAALSAIR